MAPGPNEKSSGRTRKPKPQRPKPELRPSKQEEPYKRPAAPFPRVGKLFPDQRDEASTERLEQALIAHIELFKLEDVSGLKSALQTKAKSISEGYWRDFIYDNQPTFSEMISLLSPLQKVLCRALKLSQNLSKHQHYANLKAFVNAPKHGSGPWLTRTEDFERAAREICDRIDDYRQDRSEAKSKVGVKTACQSLKSIWIDMLGQKFIHKYKPAAGAKGQGETFVAEGPLFVAQMLKAIDPSIEISSIRAALEANDESERVRRRKKGEATVS